ncbi:MAG TPA: glycosyltransferase family 1 protein [Isosphaeraceae bacterium]|jgi:glycosyltransferase involved in cell wall biosynthesis|nr:glycosyltransferase family 1 protein [Isosphaeraceae bacterium]
MRIGIDGACLANRRGFGRFARLLLAALAEAPSSHEFLVFVDRPSLDSVQVPQRFATCVVDVHEAPSRAASASGRRSVRDLLAMGRAVARSRLDLMFFPASYSYFPVWSVPKVVVTMHDTLALAHPEWVFPTWRGRLAWKLKEYAAARQADRILTVSETAKRDILDWFGLPAGWVCVATEGPDAVFRPMEPGPESEEIVRRYGITPGSRYLLYVGGLSPHKNLPRLIEAFAQAAHADVKLVIVGDFGDVFHTHVPELRAAVAKLQLESRVLFTGYVPDDELAFLYSMAYALVQPSLMEGFGLPPVEAMACGTPVVCSTAGSLPEVVGNAGLFFEPTDVQSIAEALRQILEQPELRERLARLALERAKRYTWSASAEAVLACFDEVDPLRSLRRSA